MFEGSLKDFTIDDLLQIVALGNKTGELVIEGESLLGYKKGVIYFENGKVKHAEVDELKGEPAIIELLSIKDGRFTFNKMDTLQIGKTITKSITDLVLTAISKMDEWNNIKSKISSVNSIFKIKTDNIPEEINLSDLDWKVLSFLKRGHTIRETALKLNMTVFDVAKITYKLVALKIIKEVGQKIPETSEVKLKAPPKNIVLRFIEKIRGL